jgi:hypothetical protein
LRESLLRESQSAGKKPRALPEPGREQTPCTLFIKFIKGVRGTGSPAGFGAEPKVLPADLGPIPKLARRTV